MKKGWDQYASQKRIKQKGYLRKHRNGGPRWETPKASCNDCLQQSQQRKEAIIEYGRQVILTEDEIIYTGPDNEATINTRRDIDKTRRRKNTQSEDSERRVVDVQDVPKTQTKRRRKTTDHKSND